MNRFRVQGIQNLKSGSPIRAAQAAMILSTVASILALMPLSAHAELVVEEQGQGSAVTKADSIAEPVQPVQTVQVVRPIAAQPVQQITVPAQAYPVQAVQPVVIAPAPQAPAPQADSSERTSRTELVRRERMREEVRNEDILQERLEELRLQDEKRRTNQVLGVAPEAAPVQGTLLATAAPVAAQAAPVAEQIVSVPVTERTGASGTSVVVASDVSAEEPTSLRLTPRAGLSSFAGQNPYAIQGRFTLGAGVDVGVSDHLTFEMGYQFSEYGVALNSATALGLTPILGGGYGLSYDANNSTGVLKQNVVDAGLKVHLLGRQSKLRPFIGGGGAYARSYLNYDARIVDYLRRVGFGSTQDYDLTQFLAHASAGMELQLSKSVVVGLTYKYYTVLSSRQNQELYNPALYGYYPGAAYNGYGAYSGAAGLSTLDKQYVGGSLAATSFYSITGTVGFSF